MGLMGEPDFYEGGRFAPYLCYRAHTPAIFASKLNFKAMRDSESWAINKFESDLTVLQAHAVG
jgi:hypothetical protein